MIYERGKVIRIEGSGSKAKTWVQVERSSACNGCKDKGKCSVHPEIPSEVIVINNLGASIGDIVEVGMHSGIFLKTSFLIYIIPVIMLLAGAGVGMMIAPEFGLNSDVSAIICGLSAMGGTFGILRLLDKLNVSNNSLTPSITKILVFPKNK